MHTIGPFRGKFQRPPKLPSKSIFLHKIEMGEWPTDPCGNDNRVERIESNEDYSGDSSWIVVVRKAKKKRATRTQHWGLLYLVERVMGGLQPPMPMPHEYAWLFSTRLTDKGHGMTTGRESLKLHLRTWEERSRSNHGSSNTEDRNDDDWTSLSGNV